MKVNARYNTGPGRPPFSLTSEQWEAIDAAGRKLPTWTPRPNFRLSVAAALESAAPIGDVPAQLPDAAIDRALQEVST